MREMKDSGVEWLGEVPAEWGFDRLGGFFSLRSEKVSDEDYAPLSVTKGGVVPQLSHVAKSDDHANRKLVGGADRKLDRGAVRTGGSHVQQGEG